MRAKGVRRIAVLAAVFLVVLVSIGALFYSVYRPWQLTWGATADEIISPMVGDELVKNPTFNATRAVTINAAAERIWPWIIQIGYKRAGFYSWDILDNDGIPSAERIMPEYQDLQVGDLVPLSEDTDAEVLDLHSNTRLLLVFESGDTVTWAWHLSRIDTGRTRLITRLRWRTTSLASQFTLDAFEIIMMRKCLLGIKRRAETPMKRT